MSSAEESDGEELPSIDALMKETKSYLSGWLAERGLPKSGRTKDILAKRVLRYMQGGSSSEDSSSSDVNESSLNFLK